MRRIGVLTAVGLLLVTALWWMFMISPKNGEISGLKDDLNLAIDTEQRLRVQIAELQAVSDAEVQYLAALGKLENLVPERPLLEDFIEQVYSLALDTGVDLQTLAPALPAGSEDSDLREISISAQVEGDFFEILGFLFGLNDMERLVRVDAIAISSSSDESGGTVLSASIEMRLFTLADLIPVLEDIQSSLPGSEDPDSGSSDTAPSGGDVEAGGEA